MSAIWAHITSVGRECCDLHINTEYVAQKRTRDGYDQERAEMSVLSDCVGDVPGLLTSDLIELLGFRDSWRTTS